MARAGDIVISTGGINRDHEIISTIFAAGLQKFGGKGIFKKDLSRISDREYNDMLEGVYASSLSIFREKAEKVGADAIINTKFDIEQVTLGEKGLVSSGEALRIQVFCTGTAVRFV